MIGTMSMRAYILFILMSSASGFILSRQMSVSVAQRQRGLLAGAAEDDLEAMSRAGASKIASMSVSERTKRAMLAEAVEDRIHSILDTLDELGEDDKKESGELNRHLSSLQGQYQDLVSGNSSDMLKTIESLGKDSGK
jgi:hypothetical protein